MNDGWDTFMGMKLNGENEKGWTFSGHTFLVSKQSWVCVLTKLQQWSSILNLTYL